jgi:hypothetical protein
MPNSDGPTEPNRESQPSVPSRYEKPLLTCAALTLVALALATAIWLPTVHLLFKPRPGDFFARDAIGPQVRAMAHRHLELWREPSKKEQELAKMRASNAEWDFMGRTFLVLSLANMALREPDLQGQYIEVIDTILDETLRLEREEGPFYFLMDYAQAGDFAIQPPRSLFIDGEIALMMGARQLLEVSPRYREPLRQRIEIILDMMEQGPVLSGESYPNECWTFCNTAALAAIKIADVVDGGDHSEFLGRWVEVAHQRLTDQETGLLISDYTYDGYRLDGPEGSSIWLGGALPAIDR